MAAVSNIVTGVRIICVMLYPSASVQQSVQQLAQYAVIFPCDLEYRHLIQLHTYTPPQLLHYALLYLCLACTT